MTNPLAKCINVAGNLTAGMLLYRLLDLIKKTKAERGGHLWVAFSREQWMADTALTLDEYKRALAHLKSLGLVLSERHLSGNKVTAFLRPSDYALSVLQCTGKRCGKIEFVRR